MKKKRGKITLEKLDARIEKLDQKLDVAVLRIEAVIEDLARMVKLGFDETVTKREFYEFKNEINSRVDGLDMHLSSYATQWHEDFSNLRNWTGEIDDRVKFIEK